MRGFLGGLITGGIIFAAVAASVSLMKPLGQRPEVASDAPGGVATAPEGSAASGVDRGGRDADLVEATPIVPDPDAAGPITTQPLDETAVQPAGKPSVGTATGDLSGPSETPAAADVRLDTDAPVAQAEVGPAPVQPENDGEPQAVSDQPVEPEAPTVSGAGSGFGDSQTGADEAPDVASGPDATVQVSDGRPAAAEEPGSETAPRASTQPAAVPEVTAQPAVTDQVAPVAGAVGSQGSGPAPAPKVVTLAQPAPAPDAGTVPPADESVAEAPVSQAPRIAALPHAGTVATDPHIVPGTPAKQLVELNKPEKEEGAAPAVPPIKAFAAPFENPDNKPLMAIVLIDDAEAIGAEALSEFPYPITFAVDPRDPDAAEKMARHRADGAEVVTLVDLARDAVPQDAETSLQVWLKEVPESVAVLEGTQTGVQGSRALSDQVAEIMRRTGHGLILQNNGLNTAQKLAAKAGVPSAVVFRDFDGAGQTPTVMRRFLDQAAFRARQEGAVIMLGRIRPDTISALLLWGLQDRAARVELAPVSAVLETTSK